VIVSDWITNDCIECGKWYRTDLEQGQYHGFDGRMITLSDGSICHVCDLGSWIKHAFPIIPFRIANAISWMRFNYWRLYKSSNGNWSPVFDLRGRLINK